MKGIIISIFCLHSALVLSAPAEDNKVKYDIDIDAGKITYESDLNDLSYSYRMETSDGTIKHEKGHFEDENLVAEGGYEYVENGLKYSVVYVADKDGYRPKVSFGTKGGSVGASVAGRSAASSAPVAVEAPAPVAAEAPVPEIKPEETQSLSGGEAEE